MYWVRARAERGQWHEVRLARNTSESAYMHTLHVTIEPLKYHNQRNKNKTCDSENPPWRQHDEMKGKEIRKLPSLSFRRSKEY